MHTEKSPSIAASDGRDETGRFKPGNKCGKGNQAARIHAEYAREIREAVTPKSMRGIVTRLKNIVVAGEPSESIAAAKLLLQYTAGRPAFEFQISAGDDGAFDLSKLTQEERETLRRLREKARKPNG